MDDTEIDDLYQVEDVFLQLAKYAKYIRSAKRYRQEGAITNAISCEEMCQNIYRHLPEWARW